MGKSENSGFFSEAIAASDLKASRSSHLISSPEPKAHR